MRPELVDALPTRFRQAVERRLAEWEAAPVTIDRFAEIVEPELESHPAPHFSQSRTLFRYIRKERDSPSRGTQEKR